MTQDPSSSRSSGSALADMLLGNVLDERFRIDQAIGRGGMGTVFSATQLSVDRSVAVKVLDERADEVTVQRFLREARVISAFSHPNIVQIVDFGRREEDGLLYIVMERIDGMVLSELVRMQRLHPNLAIEICAQIAGALAEAHSHKVIHRDLKPSNVMVSVAADSSLSVKVLDFGVAHVFEETELTRTGQICGTPAYMSPEQVRGEKVAAASDVYALGLVLFEMLGGFRPYAASTPLEIAVQQIHGTIPSLRPLAHRGEVPAALLDLCERMVSKNPEERPADGRLARDALLAVRRQEGLGALALPEGDPWKGYVHAAYARHGGKELLVGAQVPAPWSNLALPEAPTAPLPASAPSTGTASERPRGAAIDGEAAVSATAAAWAQPPTVTSGVPPTRQGDDWAAFRGSPGVSEHGQRHQIVDPNLDPSGYFQRFDTSTLESALIERRAQHVALSRQDAGASAALATGTREIEFQAEPFGQAPQPLELDRPEQPVPRGEMAASANGGNWGDRVRFVLAMALTFVIALGLLTFVLDRASKDEAPPLPTASAEVSSETREDESEGAASLDEGPEVGADNAATKATRPAKKTKRSTPSPAADTRRTKETIDLFEDQSEATAPAGNKIVIDETKW